VAKPPLPRLVADGVEAIGVREMAALLASL